MTLPEWKNTGPNQYDYAINGIPFMSAATGEYPYLRESITSNKDQFDTAKEAGEQSLQNWWYRSQSSFDLGANVFYTDTAKDENIARRFYDSHGVDALAKAGEVVLQNQMGKVISHSDTNQKVLSYNLSVSYGYVNSFGSTLHYSGTTPAGATVGGDINWGGTTEILDFITDGTRYYVLSTNGIYAGNLPSGAGTKLYNLNATSGVIAFVKDRLMIAITNDNATGTQLPNSIYELTTAPEITPQAPVAELPTYLYKSLINSWRWTAIAEGPNGIYFSGYSGEKSGVFFATIQKEANDAQPKLVAPYLVAEFPNGEIVLSMVSYLSVYIILGTNKGVRGAIIDSRGTLVLGQETLKSDAPVMALYPRGDFCYAGGAKSTDNSGNEYTAIYKIDLSKTTKDGTLLWSYQKDLFADLTEFNKDEIVTSITNLSDEITVFAVAKKGIFKEKDQKVTSGWIETGKIRLDTAEDKIFQYIRTSALPTDGFISVYWRNESNELQPTALAKWYCKPATSLPSAYNGYLYNADGIRVLDTEGSDAEPHPYISYRFVLQRGIIPTVPNGTIYANSPVLLSYQVKANPSYVKQHNIRVPLLALSRETPVKGMTVERSVADRIKAIESSEEKGAVVRFQDFGTGENRLCIIEKTQFVSTSIPQNKNAAKDNSGILLVTLRTIDHTHNYITDSISIVPGGSLTQVPMYITAPKLPDVEVFDL